MTTKQTETPAIETAKLLSMPSTQLSLRQALSGHDRFGRATFLIPRAGLLRLSPADPLPEDVSKG